MSTQHAGRPWYCRDKVVDEYKQSLTTDDENFPMLRTLKIIRAIIVNVGIIAIAAIAIRQGGDPTILGLVALSVLGGYNGLEMGDYMALVQAYKEVQTTDDTEDNSE